jgi:predicted  nucleic acid-binding Zn-ribbon protein
VKLLLEEIEKLKWLLGEKNNEIQSQVIEKRELRRSLDDLQLRLGSEIDTLKNKLHSQQAKHAEETHGLMARANDLANKAFNDSEGYHARVHEFRGKISKLEANINDKQSQLEKTVREAEKREKELKDELNNLNKELEKSKREAEGAEYRCRQLEKQFEEYKNKAQAQMKELQGQLSQA